VHFVVDLRVQEVVPVIPLFWPGRELRAARFQGRAIPQEVAGGRGGALKRSAAACRCTFGGAICRNVVDNVEQGVPPPAHLLRRSRRGPRHIGRWPNA